jgi:hypothetical protein
MPSRSRAARRRRGRGRDELAANARDAMRFQRIRQRVQRGERIEGIHVRAHRGVAIRPHHEIALQHAVPHRPAREQRRGPTVVQSELRDRGGAGDQLLVGRGHEQLVRVARVERFATPGIHHQQPPLRAPEVRRLGHRVDELAQRGPRREGRRLTAGRGISGPGAGAAGESGEQGEAKGDAHGRQGAGNVDDPRER